MTPSLCLRALVVEFLPDSCQTLHGMLGAYRKSIGKTFGLEMREVVRVGGGMGNPLPVDVILRLRNDKHHEDLLNALVGKYPDKDVRNRK